MTQQQSNDDQQPQGGWIVADHTKSRLPKKDHRTASVSLLLKGIQQIGQLHAENLWLLLVQHPKLMAGFLGFASRLMPFGTLDRRDTELVILRVAWNCRCRYEWGQHVDIGMRVGLTGADIQRVMLGCSAAGWSVKEAAIMQACDEFHQHRNISDQVWSDLSLVFDAKKLLELLMLIGFYEGLAGVLNAVRLPLDQRLADQLAQLQQDFF